MKIDDLLNIKPNSIEGRNKKTYSYSKITDSFTFYYDQYDGNRQFNIGSGINKKEDLTTAPKEMIDAVSFLQSNLPKDAVVIELGGSKYQGRSGFPYVVFDNYFPLDISLSNIIEYSEKYDRIGFSCDAHTLPFKDNVIDAIFTHTFLEHPLNPDMVVKEIHRVLKYGGIIIHSDAWNCRWWQRLGIYGVKKWRDLTLKERGIYLLIYLTEAKIIRIPLILLKRFFKTLFLSNKHQKDLLFKKLKPNYELKLYCDEDAASSIDPIDLIRFYESRGYELANKKSFLQRILFNDANLYFIKRKF
jgi:ubiquinone/menaquinone biosynthesis C-methylase UbiE